MLDFDSRSGQEAWIANFVNSYFGDNPLADGQPLLSWRFLILSYFGSDLKLDHEFRLDEPLAKDDSRPPRLLSAQAAVICGRFSSVVVCSEIRSFSTEFLLTSGPN